MVEHPSPLRICTMRKRCAYAVTFSRAFQRPKSPRTQGYSTSHAQQTALPSGKSRGFYLSSLAHTERTILRRCSAGTPSWQSRSLPTRAYLKIEGAGSMAPSFVWKLFGWF